MFASLDIGAGSRVGPYEIVARLGRGGMGAVYRATHLGTGRAVAIKLIVPRFVGSPDAEERFRREARALGRLRHPNVVDVTDFGAEKGPLGEQLYLVMELVDGRSLRAELADKKKLALASVLKIVDQIARALDAAHAAGIVHRDLKPENVQLVPLGDDGFHVKVLDFGIAKLAGRDDVMPVAHAPATDGDASTNPTVSEVLTGAAAMGTPPYMAPEQFFAEPIDARSDVYALAAMTWELLSGVVPRDGSIGVIAKQHENNAPLPKLAAAGVPRSVRDLLVRSLARDPAARPQSAGAFAARLRVLAAGEAAVYELACRTTPRRVYVATALWFVALPFVAVLVALFLDDVKVSPVVVASMVGFVAPWLLGGCAAATCGEKKRLLDVLRGPVLGTLSASGVRYGNVASLLVPLLSRLISAFVLAICGFAVFALFVLIALDGANAFGLAGMNVGDAEGLVVAAGVGVPLIAATIAFVVVTARQIQACRLVVAMERGESLAVVPASHLRGAWRRALPLAAIVATLSALFALRAPLLHIAALPPLDATMVVLVAAGADVHAKDGFDPLVTEIERGGSMAVMDAIERRRDVDSSPLLLDAVAARNPLALEAVLASRVPHLDVRDAAGRTALSRASDIEAVQLRDEMIVKLLSAGASADVVDNDGRLVRDRLRALGDARIDHALTKLPSSPPPPSPPPPSPPPPSPPPPSPPPPPPPTPPPTVTTTP